jgi:hypothetical protein
MGHVKLLERDADGLVRVVTSRQQGYQIKQETPVIILKLAKILQERYGFVSKKPVATLNETVIVCTKEDWELVLGWDNGEGTYVLGRHRKGEADSAKLGAFLEGIFNDPVLADYVKVSG